MDRQPHSSSSGRTPSAGGGAPPAPREQTGSSAPPNYMNTSIPRRVPPAAAPAPRPQPGSRPPSMDVAIPRRFSQPPPSAASGYPPMQQQQRPHISQSHGYQPEPKYYRPPPPQHAVSRAPPPPRIPMKLPPAATSSGQASMAIPRRSLANSAPRLPTRRKDRPPSHISIKSENPLVIKIKTAGIPMDQGGIPRLRSSGRAIKRKRQTYQEMDLTDSDDVFSSEDEENENQKRRRLKKSKTRKSSVSPVASEGLMSNSSAVTDLDVAGGDSLYLAAPPLDVVVEAPPPGVLGNLWYSRECVLHLFVIDKILGWKTRPVVKLEFGEDEMKFLDPIEAANISTKALSAPEVFRNGRKRMEVSRIHPTQCPIVLPIAAAKEEAAAKKRENNKPRYSLAPEKDEQREEVLLVKWRGRSYMHCSWERRKDLEKFDHSNSTARHKIRRYLQGQEVAMGKNWKQVLEEERASVPDLHPHDPTANAASAAKSPEQHRDGPATVVEEEELFPPEFLEVERILACDENKMDMNVLARQRAYNIRDEQEAVRRREEEDAKEAKLLELKSDAGESSDGNNDDADTTPGGPSSTASTSLDAFINGQEEAPWDPEDNVRYVVKWKGLQYSELTWEYWRDIKFDAVDQAEDFWYRQHAPDLEEARRITNRPHPHMRDFRKLTESPKFGFSTRNRPVADLGDGSRIQEDDEDKEADPGLTLRSYQLEGVNWLLFNWWNRRSCILADEMGLGKTIQTVGFLHELHNLPASQVRGPFLIVAPLSLIAQWQSESQSWAPDMNVVFYHGSADARDFLAKQEFYYTDQFVPKPTAVKLKKQHVTKFHILITTYEVVLKDVSVLSKIRWKALVVDEAHRLKNPKARLFEELASVPREFCLLLTGTPLQNSTEELWALLHFSDPVAFASKDAFVEKFGQLTDSKQVSDLHSVLRPYLLRRVKEDVEKSLPPKEETILEVTLTPIQKTFYKAIYEKNTAFLYKGSKPSNAPSLMNVMMELRKCCNHPFLVRGAEERILLDAAAPLKGKKDENGNDIAVDYLKLFGEHLVKSSGKMVLLAKLLPKLQAGGHKVLIFSQMVRVLDLLEELLKMKRYRYERLDGATSAGARTAAVDRFHRKSCQRFVMLLSTRAGGLGLNLTAADTVIIFDSDWNPQNDLQAMARAHRIGQTRAVRVYRLLTSKTYEMHMFHSASMKLGLDRAVLAHQRQQGGDEGDATKSKAKSDRQLQAKEIDELLKKGAYDVFRDDDDKEAQQFMETDIDQLLERSSRTVTYGSTNTSISSGLGSFSKASFVADIGEGGKDVDLDDPDFWEKAVGLDAPVETPDEIAAMIDDGVKRSRKQVQVFDPYAAFAEAEQKKKDKIALKVKEEKEAKDRLRLEKKQKKREEKERKKRERDEARGRLFGKSSLMETKEDDDVVPTKEGKSKSKKAKKAERKRRLKRVENEDPVLERLKQAWETPQRNRGTSAALRFGFNRFCKVRQESSLTSLPIQDLEVFFRSYVYQLGMQVAVPLLSMLHSKITSNGGTIHSIDGMLRPMIKTWLETQSEEEINWLCESVCSAIKLHMEVASGRRFLRLPHVLAEVSYVSELRRGAAFRGLRRIGLLFRLNRVIEDALDSVLLALGHEELGKRGCSTKDLSTLDVDLKARHVTTEELLLAVGALLGNKDIEYRAPAVWWDRSCDLALLVGTFVHGFGNYEAMRNDEDLPFANRIRRNASHGDECCRSYLCFDAATNAVRKAFDDALDSAKAKAQEEAHQAVAAAVAATKAAEQEGHSASAENDGQSPAAHGEASVDTNAIKMADMVRSAEAGAMINVDSGDDSHYVTLPRLSQSTMNAFRAEVSSTIAKEVRAEENNGPTIVSDSSSPVKSIGNDESRADADAEADRLPLHHRLPMPDARVLDCLLLDLIACIEKNESSKDGIIHSPPRSDGWETPKDVGVNEEVRAKALSVVLAEPVKATEEERRPYQGVGFNGSQCGSVHRQLDDGSDYGIGPASSVLVHVASGNDSPRYLRAIGVPMNVTRYCVSGLLHADTSTVNQLISIENKKRSDNKVVCETGSSEVIGGDTVAATETEKTSPEETASFEFDPKAELNPAELMPPLFGENTRVRAGVCAAALHCGLPPSQRRHVDDSFAKKYRPHDTDAVRNESMFAMEHFVEKAVSYGDTPELLDHKELHRYMDAVFLPFCLKLCVNGNGPGTRNARGSRGAFETAFGLCLSPEHTLPKQSPLPDPIMPLASQSIEAVVCASAILRRVRLMRAVQYIVGGTVSLDAVIAFLSGPTMRKDTSGLPLWWCPWIHDLGLLVHAATHGLFSVVSDRHDTEKIRGTVFEVAAIEHHISSTFVSGDSLPKALRPGSDEVKDWIKSQATEFPSANVIERRLALLCSEMTASAEEDCRYDNVPMFDHGGWPRN